MKENAGKVAVERGPVVYCAEAIDNGGKALGLVLDDACRFSVEHRAELLGGVTVIRAELGPSALALVPYFAWNYRGPGEMAVWLAPKPSQTVPAAAPPYPPQPPGN